MQAHLGDRPGDGLQRLVEPVDWKRHRARPVVGLDSCFQHVNIVPAEVVERVDTDDVAAAREKWLRRSLERVEARPARGEETAVTGKSRRVSGDDVHGIRSLVMASRELLETAS